jgi:hypothetical protein
MLAVERLIIHRYGRFRGGVEDFSDRGRDAGGSAATVEGMNMRASNGVTLSHSTILRWVQRYVPEFEKRWGRYARPVHSSWRMDETAVSVRGGAHYLYRAVDKHGKTVDSLLCTQRISRPGLLQQGP